MRYSRGKLIERQDFVKRRIGHDARNQRGVHRVPGALGDHVPQKRLADQRQVADQVEHFMPAALVAETAVRRDSSRLSRPKQTAVSSEAPRINPMLRI